MAFCNKNNKSNKFFVNNSNFLDNNELLINFNKSYSNNNFLIDYFTNGNIRMANANNTKILYNFFGNNSLLNFNIINQYNKVIYIDITYKTGFALFVNIFII